MRLLLIALTLGLLATPAVAQIAVPELTPEQERTAHEAMLRLRSPVTPFHTVDMCPSVPATVDRTSARALAGCALSPSRSRT